MLEPYRNRDTRVAVLARRAEEKAHFSMAFALQRRANMRHPSLIPFLIAASCTCFACGDDTTKTDAGSDASADASGDATAQDSGQDGGTLKTQCETEVGATIDGGCTRCWPAALGMCDQGNPGAVLGMLHCLTTNSCWSEFDYNTAASCMQGVIATYGDANVTAVGNSVQALGCPSYYPLALSAIAAEMSDADRATFAACVAQISFDGGTCVEAPFDACLNQTHYQASLCQN